jgi:hypothetical protein
MDKSAKRGSVSIQSKTQVSAPRTTSVTTSAGTVATAVSAGAPVNYYLRKFGTKAKSMLSLKSSQNLEYRGSIISEGELGEAAGDGWGDDEEKDRCARAKRAQRRREAGGWSERRMSAADLRR